ncbi:hypothetical protein F4825DRAFT_443869 [Nemania diffusa]|nr:hypothetical protein F4825DRAFT_443869 [Nemania diffusa]
MRFSILVAVIASSVNLNSAFVVPKNRENTTIAVPRDNTTIMMPRDSANIQHSPTPHYHCFASGVAYNSYMETAAVYAHDACDRIFGERNYTFHLKLRACYNLTYNLRVEFTSELVKYPNRFLPAEYCFYRMSTSVLKCPRGGRYKEHNWAFRFA